jgi:cobalamin biosynthesis protein CobT
MSSISKPQFPPPPFRAKPVPITALSTSQLAALLDLQRLKKEAEQEVERLIAFLDMTDGYTLSERDLAVDDDPCDGDVDLEPSLCGVTAGEINGTSDSDREREEGNDEPSLGSLDVLNQTRWAQGKSDEREGGEGSDDREPNVDDEYDDHHGETDTTASVDDEPSLGWPEAMVQGRQLGGTGDRELCAAISPRTIKMLSRYRRFDGFVTNLDGKHICVERWCTRSYLRNLSDRQRAIVKPRIVFDSGVGLR